MNGGEMGKGWEDLLGFGGQYGVDKERHSRASQNWVVPEARDAGKE